MDGNEKDTAIKYGLIGGLVLVVLTGGALLIPLLVLGAIYYFYINKTNPYKVINSNGEKTMPNLDFNAIQRKFRHTTAIVVIVVLAIVLLINMIAIIPAGQTGVMHVFGDVRDDELSSGIHLINPLASVERMSIRTEQYTMSVATAEGQRMGDDSIEALTKEGLKVGLDMTILYHLVEEDASEVYRTLGIRYDEKILRPEVRSAIREVIALYEAKDIYSEKREEAVERIEEILSKNINPRGIVIEAVLLRNVKLPEMLASGIEEKLTAEQEAQKYDFILQREEKEAERKRIEAQGQRDAQQIINQSLTDRYLQYLYIQNLENREGTVYVPYDLPLLRGI